VLNENPAVNKKTRDRILKIIQEYNYKPNEIARSLALKHTRLLGLIVKDISNPLYGKISMGVEQICNQYGYSLIIGNTHKDWEREVTNIAVLERRRVDGLIIFPLQKHVNTDHIAALKKNDFPFILLAEIPGIKADLVRAEDESGAFQATTHLIRSGCRRVAYLKGPSIAMASDRRLRAYKKALTNAGLQYDDDYVLDGGWRIEDGYQAGKALCKSHKPLPDGIFCYNDSVAIGLLRALVEGGKRIPEDVAIVGFDDAGMGGYLETALTSVRQPAVEIGRKAAELLLRRIKNKNLPFKKIFLKTELIVRETCGAKAKGCVPVQKE
jgi:DNA-binding LacI/PurR family transcriptional regulator